MATTMTRDALECLERLEEVLKKAGWANPTELTLEVIGELREGATWVLDDPKEVEWSWNQEETKVDVWVGGEKMAWVRVGRPN